MDSTSVGSKCTRKRSAGSIRISPPSTVIRSVTGTVPECSIVLREGQLAGWCADGRLWGDRYFTGSRQSADRRGVFESSIGAFAARVT